MIFNAEVWEGRQVRSRPLTPLRPPPVAGVRCDNQKTFPIHSIRITQQTKHPWKRLRPKNDYISGPKQFPQWTFGNTYKYVTPKRDHSVWQFMSFKWAWGWSHGSPCSPINACYKDIHINPYYRDSRVHLCTGTACRRLQGVTSFLHERDVVSFAQITVSRR